MKAALDLRRRMLGVVVLVLLLADSPLGAYPIAEEREIGERFALEVAAQLPLVREPAVLEYVNRVGNKIVAALQGSQPFTYRFHVVRDSTLNAFAVPGGFVYVNSGLLLRARTESELGGVLAHEIAHVHAHHVVRQQEKTQLLSYASLAGILLAAVHPALAAAATSAGGAVSLSYQREFEREADAMGLRYMRAVDLDPRGMVSFMKRIWDEQRTMTIDIPPYWLSHPMTDERITNLETALRDLKSTSGTGEASWEHRRMQAVVRALGEDVASPATDETRDAHEIALAGLTWLYTGDVAAARSALEKAQARGVPELESAIGLAALRSGDLAEAVRVLRGRVETEPDDVVARASLGTALLRSGDLAGAREELKAALEKAPYLDEAQADLAQSYGRAGDKARGFYHLARALELRGDLERARANFEKAAAGLLEGDPAGDESRARIGVLEEAERGRVLGR